MLLHDAAAIIGSGSAHSANYIDFGARSGGTQYLNSVGEARMNHFGLHIVITTVFTTDPAGGIIAHVYTGTTTTTDTDIASRKLTVAQLIAGAHYFVPVAPQDLKRYADAYIEVVSGSNNSSGKMTMWFGPDMDGSI
jgi:hypothetical protein